MQALSFEEYLEKEIGYTKKAFDSLRDECPAKADIKKNYEKYLASFDQAITEGKSGKKYGAIRI